MPKKGEKRGTARTKEAGKSGDSGCRGLFVVGTDTGVGKTHVAAMIARQLVHEGLRVGVYKPVASGCRKEAKRIISDDALQLWEAAGKPGRLEDVCPQRFLAPIAPHLAARAEGKEIDAKKLRTGLKKWSDYDFVVVEGAGGWLSPLGENEYVSDLACDVGFPVVVVAANRLGAINQTLQTLVAISFYEELIQVAGIVLNDIWPPGTLKTVGNDLSIASNFSELQSRCVPPILVRVRHGDSAFRRRIQWASFPSSNHSRSS